MKKAIIYLFTGTGNTLKVGKLYKEYLSEYETFIYVISVNNGQVPNPNDYDLVGFGYPIHAFNAPEPFVKFIKKIPDVQNKKTFIFKSSGEGLHLNDGSSGKSIRILKKKGYNIVQERHIVMPYNIIYRHTDGMAKQMWIYANAMVKLNCIDIVSDKEDNLKVRITRKWFVPILRIEWFWARFHGPFFKVKKKKCINCDKCINSCPMGNITKNSKGKYKFHHKCSLCMKCSFHCPKGAINVGIFRFWKVTGDYHLEELVKDEHISFPYINGKEKGVYKMYRKYYRECDQKLKEANIPLLEND